VLPHHRSWLLAARAALAYIDPPPATSSHSYLFVYQPLNVERLRVLQSKLEEIEADLTVINENSEHLRKTQSELIEFQLVLEKAGAFFDEARMSAHGTAGGDSSIASAVDAPLLDDVPV
jgi:hypothetical protein